MINLNNVNLKDFILDSISEGVIAVNKDFKIVYINSAAERITGYLRDEVIGKFCKYVIKPGECAKNCPIALALKSKKNISDFNYELYNKSGNKNNIVLNSSILYDSDNVPIGGILTFRELTETEKLRISLMKDSDFYGIIGKSNRMTEIYELISEISESDAPVFITGESGTGKEMVANAIQAISRRKNKPYIKINCAVFPPNLLAAELFGHVKGAFTDAIKDRPGRFEIADGGTIFLDEIGEIPVQTQLQLLRVLQEGTFERIGESLTRKVNVRVIAATNKNIKEALNSGTLREDLFYRLNVIPIHLPPLRERKSDITNLISHFLKKFSLVYDKNIMEISDNALDILMKYNYPGNVRELENIIEYAFVRTSQNSQIDLNKLPPFVKENTGTNEKEEKTSIEKGKKYSKDEILNSLAKNKWNKNLTADELNISRTTLWRLMHKYGLIR
jgi:PAS domain S-box-containing protein